MSLFSRSLGSGASQNSMLYGLRAQISLSGSVIPILYGTQRMPANAIWSGDWQANPVKSGKLKSSKGGGQQYDYKTALILALCQGPISGLLNVWLDTGKITSATISEQYTVPSGGGSYTVGNASNYLNDLGSGYRNGFSIVVDDPGSPGPATIAGTQNLPFQYTNSLTPGVGQYTVNRTTGTYTFGPPPTGTSVPATITYSFAQPTSATNGQPLSQLNLTLFTGGLGQTPWTFLTSKHLNQAIGYSQTAYLADDSMDLGSAGIVPNYNFEILGQFLFGAGIIDAEPSAVIWDLLTNPFYGSLIGTNFGGAGILGASQPLLWATTKKFLVGQTILDPFNHLQKVTVAGTTGSVMPTWDDSGGSTSDGSVTWLDLGYSFVGNLSQILSYCCANGIFVSPLYDQQVTFATAIQDLLDVSNSAAFFSEGILKFQSYGDTTAIANGQQFNPATQPIFDLDDDDYLVPADSIGQPQSTSPQTGTSAGQPQSTMGDPIRVERPTVRDATNAISIEWLNRGNNYNPEPIEEKCDWAIAQYGLRTQSPKNLHMITTQPVAATVANTMLKRSVYVRNQYTFQLGWQYIRLEPMDMLTLSDPYLGLNKTPCRIISIEEDGQGVLTFTAEEFPWGTAQATLYPKQVSGSFGPGYFSDPGNVNPPVFFEPLDDPQQFIGKVLMGLSGGANWGGAVVYISADGTTYNAIGQQNGPADTGFLTAPMTATASSLAVDLTESLGSLGSFSGAAAVGGASLILVDQELMLYVTATLTAPYNYTLTGIVRGVYGTTPTPHATDAPFMFIGQTGDNLFAYTPGAGDIGQLRYFKFSSFNNYGQMAQPLPGLTAYQFFVQAPRPPYPWGPGTNRIGTYNTEVFSDAMYPFAGLVGNLGCSYIGVAVQYTLNTDGTVAGATMQIFGGQPQNIFSQATIPPDFTTTVINSGGFIPAGTFLIALAAVDANGGITQLTNPEVVTVASPSSQITVTPTLAAGSMGYIIYASRIPLNGLPAPYISVDQNTLSPVTGQISGGGAVTINHIPPGPWSNGLVPDQLFSNLKFRAKYIYHGGIFGIAIPASGFGATTLTIPGVVFGSSWTNRIVSVFGVADVSGAAPIPIVDMLVTSSSTSGSDTILNISNLHPSAVFSPFTAIIVVMRFKMTIATLSLTDAGAVNTLSIGFQTTNGGEGGRLCRIVAGTGIGQTNTISIATPNTSTTIFFDAPWAITPDSTSVFIIEAPTWFEDVNFATPASALYSNYGMIGQFDVQNLENSQWLLQGLTVDQFGQFTEDGAPLREIYVQGNSGNVVPAPPGYFQITGSSPITPDWNNGAKQQYTMVADTTVNAIANPPLGSGQDFYLLLVQDATGGRTPTFDGSYIGIPTPSQQTPEANGRTTYHFTQTDTPGVWQFLSAVSTQ